MTISKAVVALLLSDAPVMAAVGDPARVVMLLAKDAAMQVPFVLITCEEPDPQYLINGSISHIRQAVSVTCFAANYTAAQNLGLLVLAALNNKRGTFGGVAVEDVSHEGGRESKGSFDDSPDTMFDVRELDFGTIYKPTP